VSVYITDNKNNAKTQFKRGNKIRYHAGLNNSGADCNVSANWFARGQGRTLLDKDVNLTVLSGTSDHYIQKRIPENAAFGKYKITIKVNCNGIESKKTKKFNVVP
jgi:hypothetical protein